MTDKQIIRAEIVRLKTDRTFLVKVRQFPYAGIVLDKVLEKLLNFIDSMPEEPASENWEREVEKCLKQHQMLAVGKKDFTEIARHFANWQKQQTLEALRAEYEKGRYDMREEMMKDAIDVAITDMANAISEHTDVNSRVYYICVDEHDDMRHNPKLYSKAKLLFEKEG